jgi:phospholipid N-methyltransferase
MEMMIDRAVFLYKFIQNPKEIGSVVPSSSFLTRKMLANLPWDTIDVLIELGAGTGVFTKFITDNKKESCQILVIEQDSDMREALRSKYPAFYYGIKAEKLDWLLQRHDLAKVDCIVSGLPFAAFSESLRDEIMEKINGSLKPGGSFIAFQYSLQMQKTFKRYFSEVKIKFVPLNIPPAFVYCCKK